MPARSMCVAFERAHDSSPYTHAAKSIEEKCVQCAERSWSGLMFVEVRTLAGTSVRLDVAPSTLVGELKDSVSNAFCQTTRYALYFRVRIVGWMGVGGRVKFG